MRASNKSELKNTDNAKYNDGISMGLRFMLCYNTISRTVNCVIGLIDYGYRVRSFLVWPAQIDALHLL